jgi:Tfp pilus assembly protein PilX
MMQTPFGTTLSHATTERGLITLGVSLSLLLLSTLVVFNVSKAVLMEQKITNNETRARQAFEAAEAGLSAAVKYLQSDPDVNGNGVIDSIFGSTAGVGGSNTTAIGTGSVTVTITDTSAGAMTSFLIASQGFSDDKSSTRTISQRMVTINPLPNAPQNPLVTKGSVVMTGSANVRNPEGQSTIWSGGGVDLGSNNSTSTQVPNQTVAAYPVCMDTPLTCTMVDSSNRNIKGVDVIENDSSLAAMSSGDFFQNFFGMSMATYKASMATIDTTAASAASAIDLATHQVIWVTGNTTINGSTVGCTQSVTGNSICPSASIKPSILVINGDLELQGTPQFYGIVYVTGSLTARGNASIYGSIIVAGTTTTSNGGSLDVYFHSTALSGTAKAGASTGSAGTWKDF